MLIALALVSRVEAKRFQHYPGDEDEAEKSAPERPAEASQPNREQTPDEASAKDDAPEVPPGLFGYALHGNEELKAEYIYTGEVFTNMRGGISTRDATRYLGLMDIALTADLKKLGFAPGGTVFVLGENSHGMGLTERFVGDRQVLSNIDPLEPFTQVTEYWWERKLADDTFTFRLGKQDVNKEFAVVDLGGDFINSSFGQHHNVPMPSWPDTAMGVLGLWQFRETSALKLATFDGAATGGSWGFSGTGDTFTIGEFEQQWSLCHKRLPGDFHVGLWYHNGSWANVQDDSQVHSGNHGAYLGLDQMLWKESWDAEDSQGLGLFLQYGWSPESLNEVPHYFGAGLLYKGLLPGRDEDTTGLGLGQVTFSTFLPVRSNETAVELFHKMRLTPHLTLQPDLQYIANPDGQYRDAFVFGLRCEAVL